MIISAFESIITGKYLTTLHKTCNISVNRIDGVMVGVLDWMDEVDHGFNPGRVKLRAFAASSLSTQN
jgi:hypothetical protein